MASSGAKITVAALTQRVQDARARRASAVRKARRAVGKRPSQREVRESEQRWDAAKHDIDD